MRYRLLFSALAIAAALICTLSYAQKRPSAASATDDEGAIRRVTQAYTDAFNKGDAEGIMAVWASDAEYVDDTGKNTKGREQLTVMFKKSLEDNKGLKVSIRTTAIRLIKDDVALQDGNAVLTNPKGEAETSPFSAVWIKKDGKWLLNHVRDLSNPGAATAEGANSGLKELEWLAGEWTHQGKEYNTTLSGRWVKGRKFLILDYVVHGKTDEILSIHQMVGWDPIGNRIRSWVFDSRGGFGEGYWSRKGDTWTVETAGVTADGRHGSGINKWTSVDANTFMFDAVDRMLDGQSMPDVKLTYNRASKTK